MTSHRDLKNLIRDRKARTGESYAAARAHVMRERAVLLRRSAAPPPPEVPEAPPEPPRVEAVVLKVNSRSATVRILGEDGQVTFRSGDVWDLAPGHLVTLVVERRWTWRRNAYASGQIENARIDIAKLGLDPLPLIGGDVEDLASSSEPYRRPDPYAPLWRKLTAKPRPSFGFDGIAWGALPGMDADENPTCDAAELIEAGADKGARRLLMEVLGQDLRCLDAHAHLGNLEFATSPRCAMVHYEIGMRIGELSLPVGFDGLLVWGQIYNRPFLRCLHGYGLCLWRQGRLAEAQQVFERMLALNPNDNQGVRFCWDDVRNGRSWEAEQQRTGEAPRTGRPSSLH